MGGVTRRSHRYCELKTGKVIFPALLLSFILILFGLAESHATEHKLFIDSESGIGSMSGSAMLETHRSLASPSDVRRLQEVTLNPVIASGKGMVTGDTIKINPFPNVEYTGIVDSIKKNIDGTVTVRASLDGYPHGYLMISTSGQRSLGTVRVPDRRERYNIMSMAQEPRSYIYELDMERVEELPSGTPLSLEDPLKPLDDFLMPGDEPVIPDNGGGADPTAPGEFGPEDLATIDVLVVYTPAARIWAENAGGINNVIAQAMEKGQLTLDNSETYVNLNLVHSAEVNYSESGNSATDLARLRNQGDGYMEGVHALRDAYQADLVTLFAVLHDVGGRAYLLNSRHGRPDSAFSITRVQQAGSSYTLMHELAHNIGLHHSIRQNESPGPTLWFDWPENRWSAGWEWRGRSGNRYASLMTYESGTYFDDGFPRTKVAHISNPNVNHDGVSTGHRADGDNARTLREMKHVVAAYRGTVNASTYTLRYEAGVGGYIAGNSRQTIREGGSGHEVEAVSNNGYHFVQWSDGRTDNPRVDRNIIADMVITANFWESFAGGGGSAGNPFLISNSEQFAQMRYNPSNHFKQQENINMDGFENWEPIGTSNNPFTGVYDGNGYVIRNLFIDGGNSSATGMFGHTQGAVIKNVVIEGADIKGGDNVGGLVGRAADTIIEQSYVTGFVSGRENIGGLVGALYALSESVVSNSYADCNVAGAYGVGGLVGRLGVTAVLENVFAVGSVIGDNDAGGLVGSNANASYENVINSFWDADIGPQASRGGTGQTTAGMKQEDTFTGWDFDNVWAIHEGRTYPYLRLQRVRPEGSGSGSDSSVECFINTLMFVR